MLIKNIKIETITKGVIERGFIEIAGTVIRALGTMVECPQTYDGEILDGEGACAYPGFIDGHTHLGMFGDSLGFEADDGNEETDPSTPHLRAIDAVNPLDYCFKEALDCGVTSVITGPGSANPIGGQMAAIKTYGKCIDRMIIKAPACIKFALGENPKTVYNGKNQTPMTRMATAAIIREQLAKTKKYLRDKDEARADEDAEEPELDMKCEALIPLLNGEITAQIHAHRCDDIFTAVRIAKEFGIPFTIAHCTQGHLVADELASEGISALCGPILCDRSKPELKELTPTSPGILSKKGILTAIVTDHPVIPVQYLPLCAGLAVREGMEYTEALKAITINPAMINGIADRVGSLEMGKDADIVLFREDPLTVAAKPAAVFVNGKRVR